MANNHFCCLGSKDPSRSPPRRGFSDLKLGFLPYFMDVELDLKRAPRGLMSQQEPRGSYTSRVKFWNWCEGEVSEGD